MKTTCSICDRIHRRCQCEFVHRTPVVNDVQVTLLQTVEERDHPKNSAFLLYTGLKNIEKMLIKLPSHHLESSAQLHQLYQSINELDLSNSIVLYPQTEDSLKHQKVHVNYDFTTTKNSGWLGKTISQRKLIVLDMTWGHSQRLMALSKALRSLPRLSLDHPLIQIIKVHTDVLFHQAQEYKTLRSGQRKVAELNSFEATIMALMISEIQPLSKEFELHNALQSRIHKYGTLWLSYERWLSHTLALYRHHQN